MYSTNLAKISLDEFQNILTTIELLPSRKLLLNGLPTLIGILKQKEITNLGALRKLLKNKKAYSELANELSVSEEYLIVLNREINSYVTKPVPLSKLEVFSASELKQLKLRGL